MDNDEVFKVNISCFMKFIRHAIIVLRTMWEGDGAWGRGQLRKMTRHDDSVLRWIQHLPFFPSVYFSSLYGSSLVGEERCRDKCWGKYKYMQTSVTAELNHNIVLIWTLKPHSSLETDMSTEKATHDLERHIEIHTHHRNCALWWNCPASLSNGY